MIILRMVLSKRYIEIEHCNGSVELAQVRSQAKHVYKYWKIREVKGKSITTHPERYQLDIAKYREELFTCIKPILAAYGVSLKDLERLQDELVTDDQQRSLLTW